MVSISMCEERENESNMGQIDSASNDDDSAIGDLSLPYLPAREIVPRSKKTC